MLQLPLKNESNCSVLFELRQVVAKVDGKEEKKEEEEEKEEVEEEEEKEEEKKDRSGGSFVVGEGIYHVAVSCRSRKLFRCVF